MRLFFLSPWPANDPLTLSTVYAHIEQLACDSRVSSVDYFTIEPFGECQPRRCLTSRPDISFRHHPIYRTKSYLPGLNRLRQHRQIKRVLYAAAHAWKPDLMICRGTTGIYGDHLKCSLGIPYVVESFEPHAHYMLQTGTWARWDPKFLVQRRWEERVKRTAAFLITVSKGYARHLENPGGISPDRLYTVPCWVNAERFRIDSAARSRMRLRLGIGDRLAVVYVGKFGGIYSPLRELAMLHPLQQGLGHPLFIMVLTSADATAVRQQLRQASFPEDQFFVDCVPHDQVNSYLNAADLALSFINSGPWSFACSAIKHGEYWACGLPLLMPPGVGDEASWLESERAGAIAPFNDQQAVRAVAKRLLPILSESGHRQRIRKIGLRERGAEPLRQVYQLVLNNLSATTPAKS